MREELTGRRPSRLSRVFRHHSTLPRNEGGTERLLDWTRCVDGDWRWYCPKCYAIVILQEEKDETATEMGWGATRRAATRHEDRPAAWLVVTHGDGTFTVIVARATASSHESEGPRRISEDALIGMIEAAFERHYQDAGHPRRVAA